MIRTNLQNRIFAALLILSFAVPVWVLVQRHKTEARNRNVELVMDYGEIRQLAGAVNRPVADVLNELKLGGVTSLAIQEETIGDLLDSGQALLTPQAPSSRDEESARVETAIWVASPSVENRIYSHLLKQGYVQVEEQADPDPDEPAFLPSKEPAANGLYLLRQPGGGFIPLTAGIDHVRNLPVGLPDPAVDAARAAGMHVVARMVNYPGITGESIQLIMRDLKENGIHTVIFGLDQVLGFRGLVDSTASAFKTNEMNYGSIEFAKQKGDLKLSQMLDARLIRVHSIPAAEMSTLDRPTAVERYVRAARERNIRMCYLRFFDTADEDPVKTNAEYVATIASGLRSKGFKLGHAAPLTAPGAPVAALPLLGVAVAIGWMFLLTSIVRPTWYNTLLFAVVFCGIAAVIAIAGGVIGRKALAFSAAVIFPTAAVVRATMGTPAGAKAMGFWSSSGKAALRLLYATAITTLGGLLAASLLSEQAFMVKVDQFAGVKLAHITPLLLVALGCAGGLVWSTESWSEQRARMKDNWNKLSAEPLLIWQAAAAVIIVVFLAVAVARSGNDSGVGVSGIEMKARALIDRILLVRPRTKEFMIGHPLMFIGIAAAVMGRRQWAIPLIVLGVVGQVSVANTFCHIHTPIVTSVLRTIFGLFAGLVMGLIGYALVRPVLIGKGNPNGGNSADVVESSANSQ